jgi:antibiotic biosynthesis monooxygenase (ABM) superfamily enzyme
VWRYPEVFSLVSRSPGPAPEASGPSGHEPVTVTVARRVAPGREGQFQDWYDGIIAAAGRYPGFLGSGILRPKEAQGGEAGDWHVVYRFADSDLLRRWEESQERADWLCAADEFVKETGVSRVSGLETWFAMPGRTAPAPPKWKMFLVTVTAIVPLVLAMNIFVLPHLAGWPLVGRTLVFSGILTGLMTWVVMPRMTRLFRRFLYGSARRRQP